MRSFTISGYLGAEPKTGTEDETVWTRLRNKTAGFWITAFDKLASNIAAMLGKGFGIAVHKMKVIGHGRSSSPPPTSTSDPRTAAAPSDATSFEDLMTTRSDLMNQVLLCGKLSPNIQLSTMDDGTPVATFFIATAPGPTSTAIRRTDWHLCVAFGQDATLASSLPRKGGYLKVEGYLENRLYTDRAGHDHWIAEVIVERLREDVPF